MIKSFHELSEAEKAVFFEFVKKYNPDNKMNYQEFISYYGGEIVDHGANCFLFIEDSAVLGCIGAVTKEVPLKGEAFIFSFYVDWENGKREAAENLLRLALKVCRSSGASVIRIGVPFAFKPLHEVVKPEGFIEHYRSLVMALDHDRFTSLPASNRLRFAPADAGNKDDYRTIHNSAFLHTPNGGSMSCEEMDELIDINQNDPEFIGLALCEDSYVGMYDLEVQDGVGWINRVGIHEDYWGQGFGRDILTHCIRLLMLRGSKDVKLVVMSNNVRAVRLYQSAGFREEKVLSVWYSSKR